MNIKKLKELIADLPDECTVEILFECTEAVGGFQYQVDVLQAFPIHGAKTFLVCHEADHTDHYSNKKGKL